MGLSYHAPRDKRKLFLVGILFVSLLFVLLYIRLTSFSSLTPSLQQLSQYKDPFSSFSSSFLSSSSQTSSGEAGAEKGAGYAGSSKKQKKQKKRVKVEEAKPVEDAPSSSSSPSTHSSSPSSPSSPSSLFESLEICKGLQSTHKVEPGRSWGQLTLLMKKQWKSLGCDDLFARELEVSQMKDLEQQLRAQAKKSAEEFEQELSSEELQLLKEEEQKEKKTQAEGANTEEEATEAEDDMEEESEEATEEQPGHAEVEEEGEEAGEEEEAAHGHSHLHPPSSFSHNEKHTDHDEKIVEEKVYDESHGHYHNVFRFLNASLSSKSSSLSICQSLVDKYNVIPGQSWGTAPPDVQDQWTEKHCDTFIGSKDYKQIVERNKDLWMVIGEKELEGKQLEKEERRKEKVKKQTDLPSIAICVCTTTRGIKAQKLEDLVLFSHLLPSVLQQSEAGFEYFIYIVFDEGDPFFDNDDRGEQVHSWFDSKMHKSVPSNGGSANLVFHLSLSSFANPWKKPGPAFNFVTDQSFRDGMDYIYRINDDSIFQTPFAKEMTHQLSLMGSPYGVAGPLCREGNTGILTHDFVHRKHHEIFGHHYPPLLTDWWMDDWVTRVYGFSRTKRIDSVVIRHWTSAHGTRYSVDFAHAALLGMEIDFGRVRIEEFMGENNMTAELQKFKQDDFSVKTPIRH